MVSARRARANLLLMRRTNDCSTKMMHLAMAHEEFGGVRCELGSMAESARDLRVGERYMRTLRKQLAEARGSFYDRCVRKWAVGKKR